MRLDAGPGVTELRDTFESELTSAISGRALRLHLGLGPDTDRALIAIAFACPNASDSLIAQARQAFKEYLVFTHNIGTKAAAVDPALPRVVAERPA